MKCPKCSHEQADGGFECLRCGIIFEKYRSRPAGTSRAGTAAIAPKGEDAHGEDWGWPHSSALGELLFEPRSPSPPAVLWIKAGHSSPYGFHDWEYLLSETGRLSWDHTLARACELTGLLIFLLSFAWAGRVLYLQFQDR